MGTDEHNLLRARSIRWPRALGEEGVRALPALSGSDPVGSLQLPPFFFHELTLMNGVQV